MNEWINAKEDIPDNQREVMVWVDYNYGLRATGRYCSGEWFLFPNYKGGSVTHWMEYPPPPID